MLDAKTTSDLLIPYWQRVRSLGFAMPKCADCDCFHFYPRPACPECGSIRVAPATASGRGSVYSYSVVHRAPSAAFADQVPYVVAIIETNEGPHLMGRIVGMLPGDVTIGLRVRVRANQDGSPPLFESDPENNA